MAWKARHAVLLGLTVAIFFAGVVLQSGVHLNHDVGWIAHSAGWLLDGMKFGEDIVDPSPPLAWYLSLPPAALSRTGVLEEVLAIRLWFWSLVAVSLLLCAAVLRQRPGRRSGPEYGAVLLAIAFVVCILPARDFGQREVVAVLLGFPYILLVACRLESGWRARTGLVVLVGVLAGLGFCLKPFMLMVPVMVESFRILRTGRWWPLLTPESISILVVCSLYGAGVMLLSPDYVLAGVPTIHAVYWAYDASPERLELRLEEAIAPLMIGMGLGLATQRLTVVHGTIAAAGLGSIASYWIQGKGFSYHAYPVLAYGWVLLVYSTFVACTRLRAIVQPVFGWAMTVTGLFGIVAVASYTLFVPVMRAMDWYRDYHLVDGGSGRAQQALIQVLRELGVGRGEYLYAFSTHPGPAFPAVNYLGSEWSGRSATQFIIPAYERRDELDDPRRRRTIESLAAGQIREVTSSLLRHPPRVVLVDNRPRRLGLGEREFDFIAFFSRDSGFRRIWACYSEHGQSGGILIFVRDEACAW